MKIVLGLVLSLFTCTAYAVPIGTTDLGPSRLYHHSDYAGTFNVSTIGLSGTPLNGQDISFSIMFSPSHFLRSFKVTSMVGFQFHLPLDGTVPLNAIQSEFNSGTGYFLNQQGQQLGNSFALSSSYESNVSPWMDSDISILGLVYHPGLSDIYGFHIDLQAYLANATIQETSTQYLELAHARVVGIGPNIPANIVPETGSTLFLLLTTFLFCALVQFRLAARIESLA